MSSLRPTLSSPPLSPPCARPLRSGRARAASLSLVAGAGLFTAYLLSSSHGPLGADSLAATRGAALAMAVAAIGAIVAAAGAVALPREAVASRAARRAARHDSGQLGRLVRGGGPRGSHRGSRLDRILEAMTRISAEGDVELGDGGRGWSHR